MNLGEIIMPKRNPKHNNLKSQRLRMITTPSALRGNENTLRFRPVSEFAIGSGLIAKKLQPLHRMYPEKQLRINLLEERIKMGTATKSDLVELDLIYQREEMLSLHKRTLDLMEDRFPNSGELRFLYGIQHFFGKKDELALRNFAKAQELGYLNGQLCNSVGAIYNRRGDLSTAESWFQRAIKIEPTLEVPYFNLAAIQSIKGDLAGAERWMLKSMSLNPCYDRPYAGLAQVITFPNLMATRVHLARIAIALEPLNPDAIRLSAQLLLTETTLEGLLNMPLDKVAQVKAHLKELWAEFATPGKDIGEFFASREAFYGNLISYAQSLP
jgi:tetratricopeptide (TPR) repeat protein